MTDRKKCGKKFALQLPQMEYTRFPWAANGPPRADALRGPIEAFGTGTAVTRPTEMICRNAFMSNILLARGSSHARGQRPPVVEINSSTTQPNRLDFLPILNYEVDSPT